MGLNEDENNYNDIFEEINSDVNREVEQIRSKISHSPANDDTVNVEKSQEAATADVIEVLEVNFDSVQFLKKIFRKIDAIEDHLIQLDVKLENLFNGSQQAGLLSPSQKSVGTINMANLKQLGLPAETQLDLDKLEQNLKNDSKFLSEIVSF